MTDNIRLKVCGLTSVEDAEFAAKSGADFLGFIQHPDSPRYIALDKFSAFASRLPKGRRVAVIVEPTLEQIAERKAAGFDIFQIHFRHDLPAATVAAWVEAAGSSNVWLAPRLPPEAEFPVHLLPLTKTFLFDTFHVRKFGGTGETGDWRKYTHYRRANPKKTWILSGGLNAANIGNALQQTGAKFVDVNTGVEATPGVKDHAKILHFIGRLHERRT
jgi:phosphoribosylanthranilate isomerase